nr:hypothetical protein BaRGS_023631 [Batillaria attramentaria]
MQLVLRVTSLNGHEEVIVDVSRVKAVVPGTEHLYRFLWQWGVSGHGSSHLVIYGQPDPRADDLRPQGVRIDMDGYGMAEFTPQADNQPCPEAYFQCEPGLALTCRGLGGEIPHWARYVDMSGVVVSQTWLGDLRHVWYLQFLSLSSCGLHNVSSLDDMHHVTVLDLSFNHLTDLTSINIRWMFKLTHPNLSHNPLFSHLDAGFVSFLQNMRIRRLRSLTVQNTGVAFISPATFTGLTTLTSLDLRRNRIGQVNKGMFDGLGLLESLYADDPKLCCSFFHHYPNAKTTCYEPQDELSSCDDLLRSDFFRGFLWTQSALALTGNVGVFVYRLFLESAGTSPGFRVLVANLCLSDFLMGVYLAMIGSADVAYRGRYVWEHEAWIHSAVCQAAGFLALMSCEVSALLQDFPGQQYAFMVFIVLNLGLFVLTGSGQLLIYRAIRNGRVAASTQRRQQDLAIARRLFLIVFSDFCCWFPIGLMGLLAARGTPIPGVVNVWSAIFVLPLNSALNPFLYTLATLLERHRKKREAKRVQKMLGRLHVEISGWTKENLEQLFQRVQRALKRATPECGVARSEESTTEEVSTSMSKAPGQMSMSTVTEEMPM